MLYTKKDTKKDSETTLDIRDMLRNTKQRGDNWLQNALKERTSTLRHTKTAQTIQDPHATGACTKNKITGNRKYSRGRQWKRCYRGCLLPVLTAGWYIFLLYRSVLKGHLPKSPSTRKYRLNPYVSESGKCTGFLAQVQSFSVWRGKNISTDVLHSPGVAMIWWLKRARFVFSCCSIVQKPLKEAYLCT